MTAQSVNRAGHGFGASGKTSGTNTRPQEASERARTTKIIAGVGIATLLGGGVTFRNGLLSGFTRIANFTNRISSLISLPVVFLFGSSLLKKEFNLLRNGNKGGEENAALVLYPLISLAFTPRTFGEPLKEAAKSPLHLLTTCINLPHILFTLLSYTGGRAMSLLKVFEMSGKDSAEKQYRTEEERKAFHRFANFGSNHASIVTLASAFADAMLNIKDAFTGNWSEIGKRFKHAPIANTLGLLFHSWGYIPGYLSKCLDTTIRCAENVKQFKYAFGGESSKLTSGLEKLAEWWHKTAQDGKTTLGKFLKEGRFFAKIWETIYPATGMLQIVTTMLDPDLRGEFFNKHAQEKGGIIAAVDKVFCLTSLAMKLFYVNIYTFSTRLPQFITSSIFYGSHLINKLRGIDLSKSGHEDDPRYIDPEKIRNNVFNRPFIRSISNWAAGKINDIEKKLNPDKPNLIKEDKYGNLTENRSIHSMVGNYETAFAKNQCFIPLREEIYNKEVLQKEFNTHDCQEEFKDMGLKDEHDNLKIKKLYEKCSKEKWAEILVQHKGEIIQDSVQQTKEYLRNTENFDEEEIKTFMKTRYEGIKQALDEIIDDEINTSKNKIQEAPPTRKLVEQSKSFWDLFLHPKELFEVLRLRTFHKFFTFLAMNMLTFVKVVDYGKKGESFRQKNAVATYTGIEIGDNEVACNLELTPVLANAVKEAGSAINWIHDILTLNFGRALSYDAVDAEVGYSNVP